MRRAAVEVALIGALYTGLLGVRTAAARRLGRAGTTPKRSSGRRALRWGSTGGVPADLRAARTDVSTVAATTTTRSVVSCSRPGCWCGSSSGGTTCCLGPQRAAVHHRAGPHRIRPGPDGAATTAVRQGYIATFVAFGTWGSVKPGLAVRDHQPVRRDASLHVGWAVLVRLGRGPRHDAGLAPVAALLHAALTAMRGAVVTANHFVLDMSAESRRWSEASCLAGFVGRLADLGTAERAVPRTERVTMEAVERRSSTLPSRVRGARSLPHECSCGEPGPTRL